MADTELQGIQTSLNSLNQGLGGITSDLNTIKKSLKTVVNRWPLWLLIGVSAGYLVLCMFLWGTAHVFAPKVAGNLWFNLILLGAPTVALGFIVWAIVKIYQAE
jgi:hypothetical protein